MNFQLFLHYSVFTFLSHFTKRPLLKTAHSCSFPSFHLCPGSLTCEISSTAFSLPVHSQVATYHIIQTMMNQTEARDACRRNNTDLVTVYSAENNTILMDMMTNASINSGWIGLSRCGKWSNGDAVTFRNFYLDSSGNPPCCVVMNFNGHWDWTACSETKSFICYKQGNYCVSIYLNTTYKYINVLFLHFAQMFLHRLLLII